MLSILMTEDETMNKKWLTMSGALGLGVVMLLAGGFSAMAGTSGYDAYKTALKNNKSISSLANTGSIIVTDNGTEVLKGDFTAKIDREQNTMSAAVKLSSGSEEHAMLVYKQADRVVLKSDESDVYRQIAIGESKWKQHDEAQSGPPRHMEPVIDALMGNMKELATVQDAPGGGQNASLNLSGSQIPAVVTVLGSLAVTKLANGERGEHWSHSKADSHPFAGLAKGLPKLTGNVQLQQIQLDAGINADRYLEQQTGKMVIAGTDDSGIAHQLVIAIKFNLSGFNQTVPDTIDLTGKQVELIEPGDRKAPWHH
jgi:hypothetical protein